ncbi:hypothetical protein MPC1_5140003 [Methylocella tundrae]|nr:hypothetical protein MPC1_5140003 [Methylocella tundrae]
MSNHCPNVTTNFIDWRGGALTEVAELSDRSLLDDHLPFGRCDIHRLAPADLIARLRRFLP